jgi:hypothetical protein
MWTRISIALLCAFIRRRRNAVFGIYIFLVVLGGASCFGDDDSLPAQARGTGRVTIVYQEDAIQPENRDAVKKIRDSGVFERMADRLTKAVALPHDVQVVISDKVPKGVDVPTTELDGRLILWPAAFAKETHDALAKFLPEVVRDKGAPKVISQENFTADVLNVWGNQFILGHELGHAVIHQLNPHSPAWRRIQPTASPPSSPLSTRTPGRMLPSAPLCSSMPSAAKTRT